MCDLPDDSRAEGLCERGKRRPRGTPEILQTLSRSRFRCECDDTGVFFFTSTRKGHHAHRAILLRAIMSAELFFCKYRAAFNLHSRRSIRSKSGDENINPCLRARLEANERSGSHFKHRSHPLKDGTCLDFLLSRHQQLCGLVVAPARREYNFM